MPGATQLQNELAMMNATLFEAHKKEFEAANNEAGEKLDSLSAQIQASKAKEEAKPKTKLEEDLTCLMTRNGTHFIDDIRELVTKYCKMQRTLCAIEIHDKFSNSSAEVRAIQDAPLASEEDK